MAEYLWFDLVKNKIGDRGCKYLSRLPLEKLRKVYLSISVIIHEQIKYLLLEFPT